MSGAEDRLPSHWRAHELRARYGLGRTLMSWGWCKVFEAEDSDRRPVVVTLYSEGSVIDHLDEVLELIESGAPVPFAPVVEHARAGDNLLFVVMRREPGVWAVDLGPSQRLPFAIAARLMVDAYRRLESLRGLIQMGPLFYPDQARLVHGPTGLELQLSVAELFIKGERHTHSAYDLAGPARSLLRQLVNDEDWSAYLASYELMRRGLQWDADRLADFIAALAPLAAPTSDVVSMRRPMERARADEDVQVTVYRPRAIVVMEWYRLLAFVHLGSRRADDPDAPDPLEEMARRVRGALGADADRYRSTSQEMMMGLPRGGSITLVPEVAGLEFNPRSRNFDWREDIHEESFQLRAPDGKVRGPLRGRLSAYLGTMLIAEVQLSFEIVASEELATKVGPSDKSKAFRKIFASYARADERIVADFEKVVTTFGDRYLLDVKALRAGERWSEGLQVLIKDADIFQLFWSSHSMHSTFCRQEWEYALECRKEIRPVYWEEPMPTDRAADLPPKALARLHFARFDGLAAMATPGSDRPQGAMLPFRLIVVLGMVVTVMFASFYRSDPGSTPGIGAEPGLGGSYAVSLGKGGTVAAAGSVGTLQNCSSPWGARCAEDGCAGVIQPGERFRFHLSGLHENPSDDPCGAVSRDWWLCRDGVCLSQGEACVNARSGLGASSTASFEVTGAELVNGLSLEVRDGPEGQVIAKLRPAYQAPLARRPVMCNGAVYGRTSLGPEARTISKLSYYLEPLQ